LNLFFYVQANHFFVKSPLDGRLLGKLAKKPFFAEEHFDQTFACRRRDACFPCSPPLTGRFWLKPILPIHTHRA